MGWRPGIPRAALLDAIYRVELPIDDWLGVVCDAAAPSFAPALAVVGGVYSIDDQGGRIDASFGGTSEMRATLACFFEEVHRRPPREIDASNRTWCAQLGARDAFGVHGFSSPDTLPLWGCFVVALLTSPREPCTSELTVAWDRVGAHLATSMNLRRSLEQADEVCDDEQSREAMRIAARVIDRAYEGRPTPPEVLADWKALASGRWSPIDQFESEGRRFVVARLSEPPPSLLQLSARERQVVAYAALGHSNKHIAYELGLSLSTIAGALRRAGRKLGARNRIALIGHITGSTPSSTSNDVASALTKPRRA